MRPEDWLIQDAAADALGKIGEASPTMLDGLEKVIGSTPTSSSGTQAAISLALLLDRFSN